MNVRWAGHVARTGEMRSAYKTLIGRTEGNRPLGRPNGVWEVYIVLEWILGKWSGYLNNRRRISWLAE